MIVKLGAKHLHLMLDQSSRVIALANLSKRHTKARGIERLALTLGTPHLDGTTLHIDAGVLVALVALIEMSGEHRTGRAIHRRVLDYVSGEAHGPEITRATIRAAMPHLATNAAGEDAYWLRKVQEQQAAHRTGCPYIAVGNGSDPIAVHVGPPIASH